MSARLGVIFAIGLHCVGLHCVFSLRLAPQGFRDYSSASGFDTFGLDDCLTSGRCTRLVLSSATKPVAIDEQHVSLSFDSCARQGRAPLQRRYSYRAGGAQLNFKQESAQWVTNDLGGVLLIDKIIVVKVKESQLHGAHRFTDDTRPILRVIIDRIGELSGQRLVRDVSIEEFAGVDLSPGERLDFIIDLTLGPGIDGKNFGCPALGPFGNHAYSSNDNFKLLIFAKGAPCKTLKQDSPAGTEHYCLNPDGHDLRAWMVAVDLAAATPVVRNPYTEPGYGFTGTSLPEEALRHNKSFQKDQRLVPDFPRRQHIGTPVYKKGQSVEYYSSTHKRWMLGTVLTVDGDGVEISVKPGTKLQGGTLKKRLRPWAGAEAYMEGQQVAYYSKSARDWIETRVRRVDADGVEIYAKPGYKLQGRELWEKLSPRPEIEEFMDARCRFVSYSPEQWLENANRDLKSTSKVVINTNFYLFHDIRRIPCGNPMGPVVADGASIQSYQHSLSDMKKAHWPPDFELLKAAHVFVMYRDVGAFVLPVEKFDQWFSHLPEVETKKVNAVTGHRILRNGVPIDQSEHFRRANQDAFWNQKNSRTVVGIQHDKGCTVPGLKHAVLCGSMLLLLQFEKTSRGKTVVTFFDNSSMADEDRPQSDGVTIPEVQDILQFMMVDEALNFDGSGSSALWTSIGDLPEKRAQPSDVLDHDSYQFRPSPILLSFEPRKDYDSDEIAEIEHTIATTTTTMASIPLETSVEDAGDGEETEEIDITLLFTQRRWKYKGMALKCCTSSKGKKTILQDMNVESLPSVRSFGSRTGCGRMFGDTYHNGLKSYRGAGPSCPVLASDLMEITKADYKAIRAQLDAAKTSMD